MKKQSQSGFTLVELAVVMIIIGLLIGGVLKGQELINNAQIAATVAQVKSVDAATTTFRDMYNGYPGDILNPGGRLPNCTGVGGCDTAGTGDNRLNRAPNAYGAADEAARFFVHLNAADLITGINPNAPVPASWGGVYPSAKIAGGFHPGWTNGAAADFMAGAGVNALGGYYLTLHNTANIAPTADDGAVSPNQAARIDIKIDDGQPNTGSVRAFGATCITGVIYTENSPNKVCGLHIRFQG